MKKVLCLFCVIFMIFTIAGCGGGNPATENGKVTLLIGVPEGDLITPMELIENFKAANPDIIVETDAAPWGEFFQKMKMQLTTDSPTPVFINDSGTAAEYSGIGAVLDLSDRIAALDTNLYTSALYAGKDADGKVWGVPHALNSIAIVYNKRIFDKYNVDYPDENWTWDDMYEIARKLTIDEDKDGKPEIYGFLPGSNITQGWLPYILANGGTPLDSTRTKSNFSDPKVREAFRKYLIPFDEGFAPDMPWVAAEGGLEMAFANGKIAMAILQASGLAAINNNIPEGFDYDVQIMPIGWDGNRYCVYVPNLWQISAKADKAVQDAAWRWIKYYLSPEAQMIVAQKGGGGFPIEKSAIDYLDTLKTVPANKKAFYKGIEKYGETLFENPCWFKWEQVVESKVAGMRQHAKGVDVLLDETHKEVQEALDDYYNRVR